MTLYEMANQQKNVYDFISSAPDNDGEPSPFLCRWSQCGIFRLKNYFCQKLEQTKFLLVLSFIIL